MKTLQSLKVRPVSTRNWPDFEKLFQSKGGPSYCWCMAWRMTKEELKENTSNNRKKYIWQRVKAKVPIGLLAYTAREPVAWCSIAPRDTYKRLGGVEGLENVWSIACFFIKKEFRDAGLIDVLIESAKKYAKDKGAKYLEAYPVTPDSPSYRFMGFMNTFEKAGFRFMKKTGTRRNAMICTL